MKSTTLLLFALVAIAPHGALPAATKGERETDRAAIDAAYTAWVQAVNAHDIDRWMTFLAPDPKFYPPDMSPLVDRDAVRAFYVELFRDPKFKLRCGQHHIEVAASGEVAWSLGACESTFTDKDGREGHGKSKWMKVWKKQPNGEWKCQVNCWNYEPAPTAMSAGTSRTIHSDGAELYFRTLGKGPPLLLLHGFMGSGQNWDPLLPALAPHFSVVVADLRGHGRSTNPSKVFTHRQAALDAFAVMDSLGIQRFSAIGHSSGGHSLLHMATSRPGRIEHMALLAGVPYFCTEIRNSIANHPGYDQFDPQARQYMSKLHAEGDEQVRELYAQWKSFTNGFDDVNFNPAQLATITARTLIVFGDRDPGAPVEMALSMYRSIPNAALWIVPSTAHMLHLLPVGGSPTFDATFPQVFHEFTAGAVWK